MFILFLLVGVVFLGVSLGLILNNSENSGLVAMAGGVFFFVLAIISGVFWGYEEGKIQGLVYSGKYEIVSNEEYSLKELNSFVKINETYLKEIENAAE